MVYNRYYNWGGVIQILRKCNYLSRIYGSIALCTVSVLISAITGAYSFLIPEMSIEINHFFITITGGSAYISFVAGFFYMIIGMHFFYFKNKIDDIFQIMDKRIHFVLLFLLLVLCSLEWNSIRKETGICSGLLSVGLCCVYLFAMAINLKTTIILKYISFRELSSIIYFCHVPVGISIGFLLHLMFHMDMSDVWDNVCRYLITFLICCLLFFCKNFICQKRLKLPSF